MTLYEAIILGIVQGIAEFLPISSSGHLILFPYLLGWEPHDLVFDVALHFGTALAVIIYFFKDWFNMIYSTTQDLVNIMKVAFSKKQPLKTTATHTLRHQSRLFIYIILVTIPVGIAGFLLEDTVEHIFRSPLLVGIMLILMSIVMIMADRYMNFIESRHIDIISTLKNLKFLDALLISLSQIIALIPGTSRSGITVSVGMFRKISREQAARFSFLLATPVILGAALLKSRDLVDMTSDDLQLLAVGTIVSFVVGILSIAFLVKYLKNHSLTLFIVYRILLGVLVIYVALFK